MHQKCVVWKIRETGFCDDAVFQRSYEIVDEGTTQLLSSLRPTFIGETVVSDIFCSSDRITIFDVVYLYRTMCVHHSKSYHLRYELMVTGKQSKGPKQWGRYNVVPCGRNLWYIGIALVRNIQFTYRVDIFIIKLNDHQSNNK